MNLEKLDIYGFKSFADKIEIKFESGITAIVGPNGAGKSTTIKIVERKIFDINTYKSYDFLLTTYV